MTSGLSCDGDSVAMTSAVNPSLEDIITGAIPGMPKVVAHNPVLAYENGAEFMEAWYDAEAGKLDPFVLIVEGSLPNEKINGEGHFAGMGVNPSNGQPITTNEWVDRLAPKAAAVVALGTCATYGGIPAMKNNPTGAMGVCDYLGWGWTSAAGLPVVNIPGCPAQPDNTTEALTVLVMALAGIAPVPELDDQHRLTMHFGRTVHEGCNRAAFYEHGNFATEYGSDHRCLVKLGCKGPVVKCNVPIRGWQSGVGGCPNVGGICMACTMPGFPDKFMPFMDEDPGAKLSSVAAKFTYGPVLRYLRNRLIDRIYDREPIWRQPHPALTTGYVPPWSPDVDTNNGSSRPPGIAVGRWRPAWPISHRLARLADTLIRVPYDLNDRTAYYMWLPPREYVRIEPYDSHFSLAWSTQHSLDHAVALVVPLTANLPGKAFLFDPQAKAHTQLAIPDALAAIHADGRRFSFARLELSGATFTFEQQMSRASSNRWSRPGELGLLADVIDTDYCERILRGTATPGVAANAPAIVEELALLTRYLQRGHLAPR